MSAWVDLDLTEHCIETAAKHAHRERVALLVEHEDLGEEDVDRLSAEMELLEEFLTSWDFRSLRASDPDLAGGRPVRVRILRGVDGRAVWAKIPLEGEPEP